MTLEWKGQQARLFPITGIGGQGEEERRGTSVFLAVLRSVDEFGRAITSKLGAPRGTMETFIECTLPLNGRNSRPDGLIRITGRGGRVWTCLVEVKTRQSNLRAAQVEEYLDVARDRGFDSVLTVSSQLASRADIHPLNDAIDPKKLKSVDLHHLSWSEIATEVIVEENQHRVADNDQALVLHEFWRYLQSPKSGAFDFNDMGPHWIRVRSAAAANNLKADEVGVAEVVGRYAQLISYAGMQQTQALGVDVVPFVSRKERSDSGKGLQKATVDLQRTGQLSGALTIPNAINPLRIVSDLKSMRTDCSITIDAPPHARAVSRISWIIRQLKNPPADLTIQVHTAWSRSPGPKRRLSAVAEDPSILLDDEKTDIRRFTLGINRPVGTKRKTGQGSFIESVVNLVSLFYKDVVQDLRPYMPPPPQVARHQPPPTGPESESPRLGSEEPHETIPA